MHSWMSRSGSDLELWFDISRNTVPPIYTLGLIHGRWWETMGRGDCVLCTAFSVICCSLARFPAGRGRLHPLPIPRLQLRVPADSGFCHQLSPVYMLQSKFWSSLTSLKTLLANTLIISTPVDFIDRNLNSLLHCLWTCRTWIAERKGAAKTCISILIASK